jgi:hypothetical protein
MDCVLPPTSRMSIHERNAAHYRTLYEAYTSGQSLSVNPIPADNHFRYRTTLTNPVEFPISREAIGKVNYALDHAWADSTMRKYANDIKRFHDFCDREQIPPKFRLPASEFLLCSFAACDAGVCQEPRHRTGYLQ